MHIDHEDDDGQLQRCMEAGVDLVELETERDVITGTVSELVDASMVSGSCVTLRRSPTVGEVDSIEVDGEPYDGAVTFRPNSHRRSRIVFKSGIPAGEITINYTTGMPDNPTARQACLWAAAHFYCNREPEVVGTITSQFKNGLQRILKLLGAGGYA
jgi:hypothetical protein